MTDDFSCPVCGSDVIPPSGPMSSPILLVSDDPSDEEWADGLSFVGSVGGVLRTEMSLQDIDLRSCRRMLMLPHPPAKGKGNKTAECLKHGIENVIKEAIGKKIVVLFGAKVVETFCEESVSSVSGLQCKSKYFGAIAFPCIAPGNVFRGGVGELRFALKNLSALIDTLDITSNNNSPVEEELEDW